ncbi:Rv2732c family membrane protein [Pseudonocardia sp. HH130630-07]|uniref:Rv2732c family membrane protein n=1 Tax=Pseudonocardia sp. HH130630-07 TaxID=1690815 RepID=UPI000814FD7E|nr:hypothetical protein [Pseudonocardia sp. HH130630-07]ANY08501.1 hypothetical protein AFB00_22010 [Pseudonocardia sp. HH130630-07]
MSERPRPDSAATRELEHELTRIAWRVERWIDPGPAAVVAGAAVAAVTASLLMPWSGSTAGWQILTGHVVLGPLPRLFTVVALTGLVVSVLALLTRFWPLAWTAATCSAIGAVTGLWAVWAQQTSTPGAEIGPGLVVTVLAVCVLFATWARIVVTADTHVPGAPPS